MSAPYPPTPRGGSIHGASIRPQTYDTSKWVTALSTAELNENLQAALAHKDTSHEHLQAIFALTDEFLRRVAAQSPRGGEAGESNVKTPWPAASASPQAAIMKALAEKPVPRKPRRVG